MLDRTLQAIAFFLLCLMPLLLAVTRAGADIALSVIGIGFLLHCVINNDWQWLRQREFQLLLLMWLYFTGNAWFLSDQPMFLRTLAWGRFIIFLAALDVWLLIAGSSLMKLARYAAVIVALLIFDTYWQYVTGIPLVGSGVPYDFRLSGPMSHPNIGNLLLKVSLPMLGIISYGLLEHHKRWLWVLCAGCVLALVTLIPLTGERSITLLMLLAMVIIGISCVVHKPRFSGYVIVGFLAMALLLTVLMTTQNVVHLRGNYLLSQLGNFWETSYGSLFIAAWHFWQSNPWFGIGIGQFKTQCALTHGAGYCDVHPHNIYLELLAEAGAIGFILFAFAMALLLWRRIRQLRHPDYFWPVTFALAAMTVLLWPAIVTQSIFSNWPAALFWYSLAIAYSVPRIAERS